MATPTYIASEIKVLVLEQANKIKGLQILFDDTDADSAYVEACMECGFEVPLVDDVSKDKKNFWLLQRMKRWYLGQLWIQYSLRFDLGDIKAQSITKNLEILCGAMDKRFDAAKSAEDTAHLFSDATTTYGSDPIVIDTGLVEDRVGQSIEKRI